MLFDNSCQFARLMVTSPAARGTRSMRNALRHRSRRRMDLMNNHVRFTIAVRRDVPTAAAMALNSFDPRCSPTIRQRSSITTSTTRPLEDFGHRRPRPTYRCDGPVFETLQIYGPEQMQQIRLEGDSHLRGLGAELRHKHASSDHFRRAMPPGVQPGFSAFRREPLGEVPPRRASACSPLAAHP